MQLITFFILIVYLSDRAISYLPDLQLRREIISEKSLVQ